MIRATVAQFRANFNEFASTSDADVERAIDDAEQIHSIRLRAQLYCAAHILALEAEDDAAGEIQSEGVGPLRVSYMTQAERGRDAFFTATKYGRRFLALERRTPSVAIAARVLG